MIMESLEDKTKTWIKAQDWLNVDTEPLTQGLLMTAAYLDNDFKASAMGEYNRIYKILLGLKPVQDEPDIDPDLIPVG